MRVHVHDELVLQALGALVGHLRCGGFGAAHGILQQSLSACVLGVVIGWWLFIIGTVLGALALSGWVFEYYRGEHAH